MTVKIGCIVEGHGEVEAVPILIRRLAARHYPELITVIPTPIRIRKNRIFEVGELERAVGLAVRSIGDKGLYLSFLTAMMTVQQN